MKSAFPVKSTTAECAKPSSMAETLFAGGSTVVFLALLVSLAGSLTFYFR